MNKIAFFTLGCKVNQYETNAMEQKFIEAGYKIVNFEEIADIYVINTCTVTNMSDKKSRQIIRKAKKKNENSIIVVTGCYAQTSKEEISSIKEINLIIGNSQKKDIVKYVQEYNRKVKYDNLQVHKRIIEVNDIMQNKYYDEFGFITYLEKTRAVIKIQDGCDRFCSYCIIPYARGRVRSRNPQNIIEEIKELYKSKGIKEVILTGIHIASYGKDFKDNIKLIDLLEKINNINGIERIRLGSLEPTIIDKDFINRLIKLEKICPHFHLSLQSGCDKTLERMNRKYTTSEFKKIVDLLRESYNNVILTTDVIVGFPGENDDEFKQTYNFLADIKFYKMHIFKYSRRNGTKADKMDNQIAPQVQEKRSQELIKLSNKNQIYYNNNYTNKIVKVLFEEKDKNYIKGHTKNYLLVNAKGDISKYHNKIAKVQIEKCIGEELFGKIKL